MNPSRDHSPRILVVDDEPFIAQLVADTLAAEGYQVDTAANGLLALEQIKRESYDLILSDLRMPDLDGLALYRELESRQPDLLKRMIFISGTTDDPVYQKFLEQVGVPVLSKPFHLDDLRRLTARFTSAP
jgi:CheY-like chemotaxis protein